MIIGGGHPGEDWLAAPWHGGGGAAVSAAGEHWSYADLAGLADRRAEWLRAAGVRPGQVVVCPIEAGPQALVMQHALARLGAVLLPIGPRRATGAPPARRSQRSPRGTQRSDPVVTSDLGALIDMVGAEWTCRSAGDAAPVLCATGDGPRDDARRADPPALIVRTSGSSGRPRAAMLSRSNVLASCGLVNRRLGLAAGDEWLCCLPLYHVGGLAIGYRCALAGAAIRLHAGFDTAALAEDFARRRVTHLSLVPPMLAALLDGGVAPPPSLRVALIGGQALSPALARRADEAGWPVYVTYGMTETFSQVATVRYRGAGASPTNVGAPLPGVEVDCAACGEAPRPLRIRGPMVMAGYANPRRRPGDGLVDGWLMTSDLGCRESDGSLHILGRADDVLVIGGVNVLPLQVEERLAQAPGIGQAAVSGVAHAVWGQTLAVCYTGAIRPADLDGWCRAHLPGPERPRIFIRRPALPQLPSGKVDRSALRDLAAAEGTGL
ncbi:MAG: AMP-binding protein [Thiohalocapsa sp.]|nr:AMP-binding protein [Thiohalocapsa sp.]